MTDDDIPQPIDPALVRYLKVLVTALTAVMILGLVAIVTLLVVRLGSAPAPALPDQITLPEGLTPLAVTYGPDWYAIATATQILIYTPDGTLRQTIDIQTD
ncbi:DUF6476 family protein [Pseudaestuariivita atlantica]|uniref:DUF6476 family protein n=1 Tax=Pseudaestuariivita atlantica TaxID=1317121 RepID=UPI001F5EAD05|nr:DUF6476 family protein [Pseudaestuariivita atlantica]